MIFQNIPLAGPPGAPCSSRPGTDPPLATQGPQPGTRAPIAPVGWAKWPDRGPKRETGGGSNRGPTPPAGPKGVRCPAPPPPQARPGLGVLLEPGWGIEVCWGGPVRGVGGRAGRGGLTYLENRSQLTNLSVPTQQCLIWL